MFSLRGVGGVYLHFVALCAIALLYPFDLAAQPQAQNQGSSISSKPWKYDGRESPIDERLPKASEELRKRIKFTYKELEKRQDLGKKAAELIKKHGRERNGVKIGGKTFNGVPAENPLDKNGGWESKWQEEYAQKDSKEVALNSETFLGCFEERYVDDPLYREAACSVECGRKPGYTGLGGDVPHVNPLIGCTDCELLPPLLRFLCIPNNFYVSESYFPVFQVAANKSGSRSLKVDAFPGDDGKSEFLRVSTKQRYETLKQDLEGLMNQWGFKGKPKWPDWHKPDEKEFFLQKNEGPMNGGLDPQEFYSVTYQTNVHANSSRDRPKGPAKFLGYKLEDKCAFHTLDDPSRDRVLSASDGTMPFMLLSMAAEFTEDVDPLAYKATVLEGQFHINAGKRAKGDLPQKLDHSQRMQKWSPFGDLKTIGVKGESLKGDYVFNGHTLAPFNVTRYNSWHDPVIAGISLATSHYYLSGLKSPSISGGGKLNPKDSARALHFSYYVNRPNKGSGGVERSINSAATLARNRLGRSGYDAEGTLKEDIVFIDKTQVAFPPYKDSGTRQGSHCFRPENIGRFAPGESESGRTARANADGFFNIPLDLRAKFPEVGITALNYANEVRIIVYIKRINCHCEWCGINTGCINLHDGDEKEFYFVGKEPFNPGWEPEQGRPGGGGGGARTLLRTADASAFTAPKLRTIADTGNLPNPLGSVAGGRRARSGLQTRAARGGSAMSVAWRKAEPILKANAVSGPKGKTGKVPGQQLPGSGDQGLAGPFNAPLAGPTIPQIPNLIPDLPNIPTLVCPQGPADECQFARRRGFSRKFARLSLSKVSGDGGNFTLGPNGLGWNLNDLSGSTPIPNKVPLTEGNMALMDELHLMNGLDYKDI